MRSFMNNKGYMLVEIILAFALAMIIMFFMTELTIKLKNKNDDMLVRTLVAADQAIIYNTIMRDLYENGTGGSTITSCSQIDASVSDNVFQYDSFKNIVSEYANIAGYDCDDSGDTIVITVNINVPQLPNDNFDVKIDFDSYDFVYYE